MLKGINLSLMIGPMVPVPAPKFVMDALSSISVTSSDGAASGFQLSFAFGDKNSPLNSFFLFGRSAIPTGTIPPVLRVIITVTLNGKPTVLMDGVVTEQDLQLNKAGEQFLLTLSGKDLSVLMDKYDFSFIPYPAMPDEARIALILAKYLALGIIPMVIPRIFPDVPIPTSHIPYHLGTDLSYIKLLAEKAGYVFYLEAGPNPGQSMAYWGPQVKIGTPQPPLSINMDHYTNVEKLDFKFNNAEYELPTYFYYDELSKAVIPIPIPPIDPLNPPLGILPPFPQGLKPINHIAKKSIPSALMEGMATAAELSDVVTADGNLDVLRYGHVLKARKLVGVRGAGLAYDGLYYVKCVTHNISRGKYTQKFVLSRNGLISTVQRV